MLAGFEVTSHDDDPTVCCLVSPIMKRSLRLPVETEWHAASHLSDTELMATDSDTVSTHGQCINAPSETVTRGLAYNIVCVYGAVEKLLAIHQHCVT